MSAEIKNRNASLVTRTDDQGHFKFSGFSKDIDPKDVEITCSKEGLKLQRTLRRQPDAPEARRLDRGRLPDGQALSRRGCSISDVARH